MGYNGVVRYSPSEASRLRRRSPKELPQRLRPLQGELLEASAEPAQRLVVVAGEMVGAVLVAKLVNQEGVHVLARTLLEPFVPEAQEVEIQPPGAIAGGEGVRGVDHGHDKGHVHQF